MIVSAFSKMRRDVNRVNAFRLLVHFETEESGPFAIDTVIPGSQFHAKNLQANTTKQMESAFKKAYSAWTAADSALLEKAIGKVWGNDGKERAYMSGPMCASLNAHC